MMNRRTADIRSSALRAQGAGLTVIELTISIAILAVLLATSMRMIVVASDHVRANDRRDLALQAAQAVSEEIDNIPWEQLNDETAAGVRIPDAIASRLPGAKLTAKVAEESDPLAKRVTVEITWNTRSDQPAAPSRLTTWVFPDDAPNGE
jgi:hypothetical protein